MQHDGLRRARFDGCRLGGIRRADAQAEHRNHAGRQLQLGGDVFGLVADAADVTVPRPRDSAAATAFWAASDASMKPTSSISR